MTLRGNYKLFYFVEFLTGILLIILFNLVGDLGLIGLIFFFIALILIQKKEPDEREILLSYKIGSFEMPILGAAMALIYFYFPTINWFYTLLTVSLVSRGLIGLLIFKHS